MNVVDLFANVGGMLLGFERAGFAPAFALEPCPTMAEVVGLNFPIVVARDFAINPDDIPRTDVVTASFQMNMLPLEGVMSLCSKLMPRALVFEFPGKLSSSSGIARRSQVLKKITSFGYKPYAEALDASDFGLPQYRVRYYVVAFRSDCQPKFLTFPFPDARRSSGLRAFLDKMPDSSLLASNGSMAAMEKKNEDNKTAGVGFRTKVYGPDDIIAGLTPRYSKGDGLLVDDGDGPRRLSVPEFKRIMGFPDDFCIPVSRTKAYELLGGATCPPVVAAIADELKAWLAR